MATVLRDSVSILSHIICGGAVKDLWHPQARSEGRVCVWMFVYVGLSAKLAEQGHTWKTFNWIPLIPDCFELRIPESPAGTKTVIPILN